MPANYLYPAGEPAPQPIVNKTINKTVNKTVNVFQPKPEHDIIDDIGRVADTAGVWGRITQVQENSLSHSNHQLYLKYQLFRYSNYNNIIFYVYEYIHL